MFPGVLKKSTHIISKGVCLATRVSCRQLCYAEVGRAATLRHPLPWRISARTMRTRHGVGTTNLQIQANVPFKLLKTSVARHDKVFKRFLAYVDTKMARKAVAHLHRALNEQTIQGADRAVLFERCLQYLFMKTEYEEAAKLEARMKAENIVPSHKLHLMLLVNEIALSRETEKVLPKMKNLFEAVNANDAEDLLNWALFCIRDLQRPSAFVEAVVRTFLSTRSTDYRLCAPVVTALIRRHLREGDGESAMRWLDYHSTSMKNTPLEAPSHSTINTLPYSTYINGVINSSSSQYPSTVCTSILERMGKDGVPVDTDVINTTLRAELMSSQYIRTIQLYEMLRAENLSGFYPNEATYQILFRAHMSLTPRQRQQLTTDNSLSQQQLMSPRALFREMCSLQNLYLKGDNQLPQGMRAVTTRSLNHALQCFVGIGDYSAAQVALTTFNRQHIYIDKITSPIVCNGLLARCRREITNRKLGHDTQTWVDLFLNLHRHERAKLRGENWDAIRHRMMNAGQRSVATYNFQAHRVRSKTKHQPTKLDAHGANEARSRAIVPRTMKQKMEIRLKERQTMLLHALLANAGFASCGLGVLGTLCRKEDVVEQITINLRRAFAQMLPSEWTSSNADTQQPCHPTQHI